MPWDKPNLAKDQVYLISESIVSEMIFDERAYWSAIGLDGIGLSELYAGSFRRCWNVKETICQRY